MKKAIVLLLALLTGAVTTFAQSNKNYEYIGIRNFPLSAETGKVAYEGVVEAKGKTAQELYTAAFTWLTQSYLSDGEIKAQQPGELISGTASVLTPDDTITRYEYLLQFKDGRYRYVLNNFVVLWSSGSAALETYFPATIRNGKAAMIQDKHMQHMHALFQAETVKLAAIGTKKESW